jgi:protein TonB
MSPIFLLSREDLKAFGIAAATEAVILMTAAALVAWSAPPPPAPVPIPLQLTQAEPEPPKPEPPKPQPKHREPAPRPVPAPRPLPQAPQPIPKPAEPTPFNEPVPPPPPPPPSSNTAGKPDPALEYAAKVRTAVQAAVVYPAAAASMNFGGRTRVEFHLRDGVPSTIHITQGSGLGMIDRAALKSVQDAIYPPPPPPMQGKDLNYQVWVEFKRS